MFYLRGLVSGLTRLFDGRVALVVLSLRVSLLSLLLLPVAEEATDPHGLLVLLLFLLTLLILLKLVDVLLRIGVGAVRGLTDVV